MSHVKMCEFGEFNDVYKHENYIITLIENHNINCTLVTPFNLLLTISTQINQLCTCANLYKCYFTICENVRMVESIKSHLVYSELISTFIR